MTPIHLPPHGPIEFEDPIHDGLGAFVKLDYDSRYEHAIVLLASNFDSMYDLIYAPGKFVENWRQRYHRTPDHDQLGSSKPDWVFETPITIMIEPIALPSPANANILLGLGHLYPALIPIAQHWQGTSPSAFAESISGAVSSPSSKIWNRLTYPTGVAPFVPQYVAEFAIKTRTLTIRYFPRVLPDTQGKTVFPRHSRHYMEPMTSMTIDPVANTELNFLHFDIVFGFDTNNKPVPAQTPQQVADCRARFAMDFINDPGFMNTLTWPGTYYSDAPFLAPRRANSLPKRVFPNDYPAIPNQTLVPMEKQAPFQPRVVIDSVWPDPDDIPLPTARTATTGGTVTTQSDPTEMPPICILLTGTAITFNGTTVQGPCTIHYDSAGIPDYLVDAFGVRVDGYQISEALIKAYSPPAGGE